MARPKKTKTTGKAKTKTTRAKKSTTKAKPQASFHAYNPKSNGTQTGMAVIKMLKGTSTKRPPNNPEMPQNIIDSLNTDLNAIKELLDAFSQHLRALDRMRLNGVGIKKMGFITRAYELALENGEFLPHYLTIDRFGADIQYFTDFRSLVDLTTQIREKLWNITIQSADIAYTDALEFYASVREAAKRRVDAAETLHSALSIFFKRHPGETEEPTEKQDKRDFNSLLHGKHDGKIVIENIRPKLTGGVHKVIDETFKDKAQFKDSINGEIIE